MQIQILHNTSCNIWQTTKRIIEELLREMKVDATIEEVVITSDEEAEQHHFSGSPQIMIDGKDIDPMAEKIKNFHASGCRMYFWKDKVYEGPPREMLEEIISKTAN